MNNKANTITPNTLLIIPCCKRKSRGGVDLPNNYSDPLINYFSTEVYNKLVSIRKKYIGSHIKCGDEYMPAIDRYQGNLYNSFPCLSSCIRNETNKAGKPKIIILSALYGPLHPETLINDYDLAMPNGGNSFWATNFPAFLSDYVKKNKIDNIRFYCGIATGYYNVVNLSATPLLTGSSLKKVIHCNVENGSSYHTPHNHGLQLATDLMCGSNLRFTRTVVCT